jgi:predicted PurR-regulated permease PerM
VSADEVKLPFYAKVTISLVGLIALLAILYIAKGILVPIVFSILIATILHPVVNFLVRIGFSRLFAIIITLLLAFLVIFAFVTLMINQISRFSEFWPGLVEKLSTMLNDAIDNAASFLNMNPDRLNDWLNVKKSSILDSSTAVIGSTLLALGNGLVIVLLIPVYVFLILYYQPLLLEFIFRFFGTENRERVGEIVSKIKDVIQNYLVGLIIETIIVGAMNVAVLMIFRVDYALILGIIGALLNLIPYLGGIIAVALPMMVAIVTKSSPWFSLYIMAGYYFVQIIDNNYIVPYIVASKVKINALFSIIVVLVGNALWGISGMFLSIPVLAIIKLICDRIDSLKPWGFLLGDTIPPFLRINRIFKKSRQ